MAVSSSERVEVVPALLYVCAHVLAYDYIFMHVYFRAKYAIRLLSTNVANMHSELLFIPTVLVSHICMHICMCIMSIPFFIYA